MPVTLESLLRYSPIPTNDKGESLVNGNGYAVSTPLSTATPTPVPSSAKSTNLLASFIESYKEIETYKYARIIPPYTTWSDATTQKRKSDHS